MSSPFQSAVPLELPKDNDSPLQQPMEGMPNPQVQQQQEAQPQIKKPQHPHQKFIDNIMELIMTMNNIPEHGNEKASFLWNFISKYVTLLENNKMYIVPILAKLYPGKVKNSDDLVVALLAINKPSNVRDFLTTIDSIPENGLSEPELEILSIIKLKTPQGPFLNAILNVIGQLTPEEQKQLDELFLNEIKKEKYNNLNSSESMIGTLKDKCIPGTKIKIWILIIVLIFIILLAGIGYWYCSSGKSSKRQLHFRENDYYSDIN